MRSGTIKISRAKLNFVQMATWRGWPLPMGRSLRPYQLSTRQGSTELAEIEHPEKLNSTPPT
jgi:hypothetical protein